ncbi:MAG: DNA polymerase subunit beta [Okeania sp. SIO3I5]|uniref:nucleotidyltransferase family protein n=1 Tax=Okeania sp. SIO3I5 TaxID=2607805 RepID=UPI0013B9D5AB|nr:nucleotidyltransferase domain-containing protein [Okeania sp. SIO3I5]NEQ40606.1 DNA polymerase subunit beta [Okeania sp. SIO3I5]
MLTQSPNQIRIYQRLQINLEELTKFCQANLISELAVFGSILRDDFSSESDLDLLISYLPSASRGLLEKIELKEKFEKLFNRPVDLISKTSMEKSKNWLKLQESLSLAEVIYHA